MYPLLDPSVLFTAIAVLLLVVIWGTTLTHTANQRAAAERDAAALATYVADIYEAQMVRALREIDHTLQLVRHNLDGDPAQALLQELRAKGLLPPELIFTIDITDDAGNVIATNRPTNKGNTATLDFLQQVRASDAMVVGRPRYDQGANEWRLYFSRRLGNAGERFDGMVTVSVHAGYFVSGYEPNVLGTSGVLGIVGTDGVFRARRSGDVVSVGDAVGDESLLPDEDATDRLAAVEVNAWDSVRRYTVARKLFDFPLAIIVGLSKTEQLAPTVQRERTYVAYAAVASAALLIGIALLGRLSVNLQRTRERVMEERLAHAQYIEHVAYHDNLTGLANRAFFSLLLTQTIRQARRYNSKLAVLFLDLDRFKTINDSLGHEAGDVLLRQIGGRLQTCVRESDVAARLGGDEFVILLPEINESTQVASVADKILSEVSKPLMVSGQECRITVSIGITIFPGDGEDEQTLMKNADLAMYHAKAQGKDNFQFYSEKLNVDSLERLALESSLRHALERDEFCIFYQAKCHMASGRFTSMEALLRWQHPDIGLVTPMQFIALAEETGLIVPIGRWVLKTACQQNVAWQKQGLPEMLMAVNLSARQFLDENLAEDVAKALRETGMDPRLLEIEITESMIMQNIEWTMQVLTELKQIGIQVAIDDFGTGYSSLSTLKQFPVDTLKIDGSFIRDVVHSTDDQALIAAVIALGHSMNLTIVVEGVESGDQIDFLRMHTCDEFQGFYINQPLPADEFALLLREHWQTEVVL